MVACLHVTIFHVLFHNWRAYCFVDNTKRQFLCPPVFCLVVFTLFFFSLTTRPLSSMAGTDIECPVCQHDDRAFYVVPNNNIILMCDECTSI